MSDPTTDPLDELEQELTRLLDERAGGLEHSVPPIARLVAEGEAAAKRHRRVRTCSAVGAAAAVLVAVVIPLAAAGHHSDNRPAPAHHGNRRSPDANGIPTTPTTLPYLDGKVLHIGEREISLRGDPTELISRGNTTLYWDQKTERWQRVWTTRGDEIEPVGVPYGGNHRPWVGWLQPFVSADGASIAVLTHPTQDTSRITIYDAEGLDETAHVDIDQPFNNWTGGGDSVVITNLTDNRQVLWYTSDTSGMKWWIWSPGMDAPARIQSGLDVEDDGRIPSGPPNGAVATGRKLVTFSPTGQMQPINGVPADFDPVGAVWSASGAVAATDDAAGPQILDLDGGGEPVRPPTDFTILRWFAFESDAYVVGAAAVDNIPSLVRCAADRSACAVISKLPADWEWSLRWASSPPTGEEAADDRANAPATP